MTLCFMLFSHCKGVMHAEKYVENVLIILTNVT